MFAGYYKDETNTAATITADGWLMTGDVGRWNPNGTLSIIDRKKNMFKLSQGKIKLKKHRIWHFCFFLQLKLSHFFMFAF